MKLPENLLQVFVAVQELVKDAVDADSLSRQFACEVRGAASTAVVDNDADSKLSSGDRIDFSFSGCLSFLSMGEVTGDVSLAVTEFTGTDAEPIVMRGRIDLAGGITFAKENEDQTATITETLAGRFDVASVIYEFSDSLAIAQVAGSAFTSSIEGRTDTLFDTHLSREGSRNGYRYAFASSIESERNGGSFTCATTTNFFDRDRGTLECAGAAGSVVRLFDSGGFFDVEVDADGDGNFELVQVDTGGREPTLLFYSDGAWSGDGTPRPLLEIPPVPAVAARSFAIDVNGAAYDAVNGLLYVTTDDGVTAIDPATLTAVSSVALGNPAKAVAVSDDGSKLWVGFDFIPELQPIDTAAMTAGTPIALGMSTRSPDQPRWARNIAVAPGSPDTVVVSDGSGDGTFAYSNGAKLPNEFDDFSYAVFKDATTLVGFNHLLSLDANGITLVKQGSGFGSPPTGFGQRPLLGDEHTFDYRGRVFDLVEEVIYGTIDLDRRSVFSGLRGSGAIDRDAGIIYLYDEFAAVLDFFDTATLRPLGSYSLPVNGSSKGPMFLTDDGHLILTTSTEIRVVSRADLVPNADLGDCLTRDYSGLRTTGTWFEVDCEFNDAIFDPTRNLVYASIPSHEPHGNSVAVIDPVTGVIQEYLSVGSEPGRMRLTADGSRLYVVLEGASRVVALDPGTRQPALTVDFPPEPDPFGGFAAPLTARNIAVSPQSNDDLLFTFGFADEVRYFPGRQPAMAAARLFEFAAEVFYTGRPDMAVAYESGTLFLLGIDSSGVSLRTELENTVHGRSIKLAGDLVYSTDGEIFDAGVLAARPGCPLPPRHLNAPHDEVLAVGGATNAIYYYRDSTQGLFACDRETLEMSGPVTIPDEFIPGEFPKAMVEAGPDRLVLVTARKLILFDHRALFTR